MGFQKENTDERFKSVYVDFASTTLADDKQNAMVNAAPHRKIIISQGRMYNVSK